MPLLTIITPTFNRAEKLKDCYTSLKQQTCFDFQWLIIDDGSSDNTETIVRQFQEQTSEFSIEYHYKHNGGKHTALNQAHPFIQGKYVVILDSDDIFTPDTVETILSRWEIYENNETVGRIIFLKGYSVDDPVCYVKHEGVPVNTLREPRIGISGRDCCDTFRTELFTKYPFPEYPDERFIGEGAAFTLMEMESLGVYYNKVLLIGDYLEGGLTKGGVAMRIRNPKGGMYNSKVHMSPKLKLPERIKKGILYDTYSHFAGVSFFKAVQENDYKLLTILCYIPGTIMYLYWKKKYI